MFRAVEHLHLSNSDFTDELVPALRRWDRELDRFRVQRFLWFAFGSVVIKDQPGDNPSPTDMSALLEGARPSRPFRSESDIDIGLVVADGHDEIDLRQYEEESVFTNTEAAGHPLSLTRFERSWVERRHGDILDGQTATPKIPTYGKIVILGTDPNR